MTPMDGKPSSQARRARDMAEMHPNPTARRRWRDIAKAHEAADLAAAKAAALRALAQKDQDNG